MLSALNLTLANCLVVVFFFSFLVAFTFFATLAAFLILVFLLLLLLLLLLITFCVLSLGLFARIVLARLFTYLDNSDFLTTFIKLSILGSRGQTLL